MSKNKLQANIEQQTRRLLDQLQQLQQNRQELSQEEYIELKSSTLQDLQTFQNSLFHMQKDPNNNLLDSEIEKSKRKILQACKTKFNKDAIVQKLLSRQVQVFRANIVEIDKKIQLKLLTQAEWIAKRRKLILQIEEIGVKLNKQESAWLQQHYNFINNTESNEGINKHNMEIVQKNIEHIL